MKCITLEYPDGSVETRGGLGPRMLARFGGDADAALQYILTELVPIQNPGATARIEDVAFPVDRRFRNAWTRGAGNIEVDMPKARTIHMDRIRVERDKALAQNDTDFAIAQKGRNVADENRIIAEAQVLKDIPQTFDLSGATTPEALDALWPAELPARS